MALKESNMADASMSRGQRFLIGVRVSLAVLLAIAAALLATRILESRLVRARWDLSTDALNTLDPLTKNVLGRIEEDITVDVYFTPPEPPFQVVGAEAQDRARRLRLMGDESGGRLRVEFHDVGERGKPSARAEARRGELGLAAIEAGGLVVLSRERRKEVLRLRGGLADFDAGTHFHKGGFARSCSSIEGGDHGCCDLKQVAAAGSSRWRWSRGGNGQGGRCLQHLGRSGTGLENSCRSCTGKVATHLQAEVVSFELQLLDVALAKQGEKVLKLVVVELHGDQFSLPK